ncbi:MAG: hypothetical protein JW839_14835 [Candidatus Lokiarchaeota archaeon]|nr:hypothetical protein [Candidatus Lokiarchaeota archaeon]
MNAIIAVTFLVLASGVAFALRGIWGHQVGGWVMGVAMATGIGAVLAIDPARTATLALWSSVTWALASFVGWANHGAWQRFVRGSLAYGILPGAAIASVLFPAFPASWLLAAAMVGLPTGAAFSLSGRLTRRVSTGAWFSLSGRLTHRVPRCGRALDSVPGLFCTHIISAGAIGSLHERNETPGSRLDVLVSWIAILLPVTLAWIA